MKSDLGTHTKLRNIGTTAGKSDVDKYQTDNGA